MKKPMTVIALILAGCLQLSAAEQKFGIVNFDNCVTDSKLGKQEQASFEMMRKQFVSLMEDTEKQLKEMNDQLQNKDFLDGLSPDAEQKMKEKFAQLNEEYNRYNQQYYQFLNQGQYKIIQTIAGGINGAADKIASIKGYNMILNKQACFFYNPALDVTNDVVKEMDKAFDDEAKKAAAAAPAPTAPAKEAAPAAKEEPKKTAAVKEEAKKPTAPVAKEETKKPAATAKVEEKKNAPEAAKSR